MNESNRRSAFSESLVVCFTSFACACAAFVLSLLVMVPLLGTVMQSISLPEGLQIAVILAMLFGFPIAGALAGVTIGVRIAGAKQEPPQPA